MFIASYKYHFTTLSAFVLFSISAAYQYDFNAFLIFFKKIEEAFNTIIKYYIVLSCVRFEIKEQESFIMALSFNSNISSEKNLKYSAKLKETAKTTEHVFHQE